MGHPVTGVLKMKNSDEQSMMLAVIAVCFWLRRFSIGRYCVFKDNSGVGDYPKGKTFYDISLFIGKQTFRRKPMSELFIFVGVKDRLKTVIFKNSYKLNTVLFFRNIDEIGSMVYVILISLIKYLGHIAVMI